MFRNGIDNPKFAATNHNIDNCTACHAGGNGATADRNAAHAGMQKIPGGNTCNKCHSADVALAGTSLHVKPTGFMDVLEGRGFVFAAGTESLDRFTKQCTKCHIHNAETPEQPACGHCHISVPNSAGGGLVGGHRMTRTPDTVSNCTACHGSRIKDEYFGQNQALFTRNLAATTVPADYPFRGATLQPDVHKAKGMGCDACHYQAEMHGAGAGPGIDRYGITGRTQCVSCHDNLTSSEFHSSRHVEAMSCHVCHSQPYKQCYGCHTQEAATGAYFVINENDPTRAARQGTATTLPAGDALITFRVGKNPKFGEPGAPEYAVLRHVPIDAETFKYTKEGTPVDGLVPNLTGLPTWKYATPHNIQRVTKITTDLDGAGAGTACDNCHGANYSSFWLTDAITDSFGWVPSTATWENTANADVVQIAPVAPLLP